MKLKECGSTVMLLQLTIVQCDDVYSLLVDCIIKLDNHSIAPFRLSLEQAKHLYNTVAILSFYPSNVLVRTAARLFLFCFIRQK